MAQLKVERERLKDECDGLTEYYLLYQVNSSMIIRQKSHKETQLSFLRLPNKSWILKTPLERHKGPLPSSSHSSSCWLSSCSSSPVVLSLLESAVEPRILRELRAHLRQRPPNFDFKATPTKNSQAGVGSSRTLSTTAHHSPRGPSIRRSDKTEHFLVFFILLDVGEAAKTAKSNETRLQIKRTTSNRPHTKQ